MDIYASNFNLDSAKNLNARNVILPCPPTANFTVNQQTVCANQPVTFTDQSKRLVNQWQWTFEGGTPATYSGQQPPPVYYPDTGLFYVQLAVSNPYGSDNVVKTNYIHVLPGPLPLTVPTEFQLKEGDEVTIETCARGSTYQWQPLVAVLQNEDTLLTVQPDETQTYHCTVVTNNGCNAHCQYTVKVQSGLLLPTAFSPNGDGVNDIFRILNTNITLKHFEIYNRWGELVFFTTDLQTGWDGTYKGVEQELGVYVWHADYVVTKNGKRKSAKGNVTLVK
ncbi:MAG: gliding motility-associated C-terminal domain-containing protein [Chitinophagales bacterium]|nr:gliding motility-associated C-terminal domain-containing protein [Chitinophagales bacterium]